MSIPATIAHATAYCNSSRLVSVRYAYGMDIREIRRRRLEQLLRQERFAGEKASLARAIGKAPAQVSQWCNEVRTISEDVARQIEERLKLPKLWMDQAIRSDEPKVMQLIAAEPVGPLADWPFRRVSRSDLAQLTPEGLSRLETTMLARIEDLVEVPRFGTRSANKQMAARS